MQQIFVEFVIVLVVHVLVDVFRQPIHRFSSRLAEIRIPRHGSRSDRESDMSRRG